MPLRVPIVTAGSRGFNLGLFGTKGIPVPRDVGHDASYVYTRVGGSTTGLDTTLTTLLPRDAQEGWTAIYALDTAPGVAVNTGPSGSTTLQDGDLGNCKVSIYRKVLDSTDISNGSLTVTRTAGTSWSGIIAVTPLLYDQISSSLSSTTVATGPINFPEITPTAPDATRLVFVFGRTDTVAIPVEYLHPDGWAVEAYTTDNHPTARRRPFALYSQRLYGPAAITTSGTSTFATANVNWATFSITVAPVPVVGDTRPAPDVNAIAVPGDSLVRQNGLGDTDIPAMMNTARGWNSAKIYADGQTGRTIVDGAVTPTTQTTIDTWRGLGTEALTWLIELGANNQTATVAQNMIDYRTLLAKIGPDRNVIFFGVGYYDQTDCAVSFNGANPAGSRWSALGVNGSPNAAMLNIIDEGTNPLTEPTILRFFDWNNWPPLRKVPDPTLIWKMDDVSSGTGQPRHMIQDGYQLYRNAAFAEAVGWAPGVASRDYVGAMVG